MKQKRLIPFSTLFITDMPFVPENSDSSLIYQIKQWVESKSFNANGIVNLLYVGEKAAQLHTIFLKKGVFKNKMKDVTERSFPQLCKKVHQLNPALTVIVATSFKAKMLAMCSRADCKIGPRGVFGFFHYNRSFPMKADSFILAEDIPELFNNAALKSIGYAQTRFIDNFKQFAAEAMERTRKVKNTKESQDVATGHDEHESVDLGELIEDAPRYLVWIPNAKKSKTAFRDFADVTYIAERFGVSITAFFRDEKLLKKFSKDFYIKGRKKDFDKYLLIEIGDRDLCERLSLGAQISIFSSSLDSLYRRERKKLGKEKVTTLYSYKKKNPLEGEKL